MFKYNSKVKKLLFCLSKIFFLSEAIYRTVLGLMGAGLTQMKLDAIAQGWATFLTILAAQD